MLPWGPFVTLLRHRGRAFADFTAQPSVVEARLTDLLRHRTGRRPSPAEAHSWSGSLPILAQDILDAGLESVEVLIEHQLPLTSKRVDVILAGRHPRTGAASFVVIELKQWSNATLYDHTGELVTVQGAPGGPRLHPVAQVQRYCDYLVDFTSTLHDERDPVAGAAYLHNATSDLEQRLGGYPQSDRGRLFTGAGRGKFIQFLQSRLESGVSGSPYADRLLHSAAAPSRQLLTVVADELAAREQFVLLDEQAVAFDLVLHAVEEARAGDHKTAVIISGGPGSGKSVIALSLMGALASRGRTVVHATGSRAFTQTLRDVSGFRKARAGNGLQVLQLLHGGRAQRTGRADPRRSAPDQRDIGKSLHSRRLAHWKTAGRRTAGDRPSTRLSARSAPSRPTRRNGYRGGHRASRHGRRAPGASGLARRAVSVRGQRGLRRLGAETAGPRGGRPSRVGH